LLAAASWKAVAEIVEVMIRGVPDFDKGAILMIFSPPGLPGPGGAPGRG
jgi:hypothetical protein